MRELDEVDLLVLCANALELHEALDLMKWYTFAEFTILNHPSMKWWIKINAAQVAAMMAKNYWNRQ